MKDLKLGQHKNGTIVLKPTSKEEKELLIEVLSETMSLCPHNLGLEDFEAVGCCDLNNCKKCWEFAFKPMEEGEENER